MTTLLSTAAVADVRPTCSGPYADDLTALSSHARELETRSPAYAFAVRTTATYECVSYALNGDLKRTHQNVVAHGTAFGIRPQGDATLLITNEHVAEWPVVTDSDHAVDGVAGGCKRIADALAIVDDDRDDYPGDDIPLERVVADPALDIAVLRANAKLPVIPWKFGVSSKLAPRDLVQVKGFPLGAFRATNIGKVISAYDHDDFRDWNHDDFVIDALLSNGNSGSPVLALSCATGEFELVGVYHAAYSRGSALNVVIAIDQLKDLIQTLKVAPRPKDELVALDVKARRGLIAAVSAGDPPFFALGNLTASVRVRSDDTLVFALYSAEFPKISRPVLVLEDRPSADASKFGELGASYFGGPRPLRAYTPDAGTRVIVEHALELARRDAIATLAYRAAREVVVASRAQADLLAQRKRTLDHELSSQVGAVSQFVALVAGTTLSGPTIGLDQIESAPRPAKAPPAP